MTSLVLASPLSGWASRLAEVPDPAFAEGMVGDGVAIDPISNELCAPCDGVIVSVHRSGHAVTLRADGGAEILLHIGVDTVELHGEGFRVLIAAGQRVKTGDPLIRFDLDLLLKRARSLYTPVLLVGGEGFSVVDRAVDRAVTVGGFLLAIADTAHAGSPNGTPAMGVPAITDATAVTAPVASRPAQRSARLAIQAGLHARPAAAFARVARQLACEITVTCGDRSANGKSLTSLLALGARLGDQLEIRATGAGASAAVDELAKLVEAGLGDPLVAVVPATRTAAPRPSEPVIAAAPGADRGADVLTQLVAGREALLVGVAAAPGLARGRAVRLAGLADGPEVPIDGAGPAIEAARLAAALTAVRGDLEQTVASARSRGDAAMADIFTAHIELLDDPELAGTAAREITAGRSAGWAWRTALAELSAVLRALEQPRFAERIGDLGDLERRTLARLGNSLAGRIPAELPEHAVLIADELLPSELAAVPAGRLAGIATAGGGATSHVAILAAGLGVPAVVALGAPGLEIPDGAPVVVDGSRGQLCVFPGPAKIERVDRAITARAARGRAARAAAHQPAVTTDGVAIAVHANLGSVDEAATASASGADGSGLVRTEFLFLDRADAPSEDEQAARYQQIADALGGKPLVIRTLDAGGDKPMPYLPAVREDNPALGVRGVRLVLRHREILRTQLRAILRVQPAGVCRIMVPMIASVGELRAVRAVLDEQRRSLGVSAPIALGAMIEVPTAALAAQVLAREADFFSIGTNDLSQYALAIDRGNAALAGELDSLHPGVLRLIASTVAGAATAERPVAVCGGAAGEPTAIPILLGLGVRALSVAPSAVPEIKAIIRSLSMARCRDLATAALELETGDEIRARVVTQWPELATHYD